MKKILILTAWCLWACLGIMQAQGPVAAFSAAEARAVYFEEHFEDYQLKPWTVDSAGIGQEWVFFSNSDDLGYKQIGDPNSQGLLFNKQVSATGNNTIISSPKVTIKPHSRVSFLGYFEVAEIEKFNVTLSVASGTDTTAVMDLKTWVAAHPDYVGGDFYDHQWTEFTADLSAFSNQTVSFVFRYVSPADGGDVAFDDFTVYQTGEAGINATVSVGGNVHFENLSVGENLAYEWTFEGGQPATSAEANPVVNYSQVGSYAVKLTVRNQTGEQTTELKDYVRVSYKTPIAQVAFPTTGYRTATNCAVFVPVNTPVTFLDQSFNHPQYQLWEFYAERDSVPLATASGKEGTVQFSEEGIYRFRMTAGNESGENTFESGSQDIMVGSAQFIWNNSKAERSITPVYYYADENPAHGFVGSNDAGITKWAEKFSAPLAKAVISQIRVFLKNNNTYKRNSFATVAIYDVDADGMPGKEISSVMKMVKDFGSSRRYSATYATAFLFDDEPVVLNAGEEFFVVVSDLPAYNNGESLVQLAALQREAPADNTAYIFQDNVWKPMPTAMSLTGIWPYLAYSGITFDSVGIKDARQPEAYPDGPAYYDLTGRRLQKQPQQGLYIMQTAHGSKTIIKN